MSESLSTSAADAARLALDASPLSQIRRLQVDSSPQGLVISGRVDSFYMKQVAQEAIREIARNCNLSNEIVVDSPQPEP